MCAWGLDCNAKVFRPIFHLRAAIRFRAVAKIGNASAFFDVQKPDGLMDAGEHFKGF